MGTTRFAGFDLDDPIIMNAGGTCKDIDGVKELAASDTSAIIIGSITWLNRSGNEGNVYYEGDGFSLNSIGLKNQGVENCLPYLPTMAAIAHDAGKPLILNVAGFTPREYALMTAKALEHGADGIEQNLGCPNVWSGGVQHEIASYDPELTEEVLTETNAVVDPTAYVAVKVSPMHPSLIQKLALVIPKFPFVKAVVAVNTFPNALSYDEHGNPRITPSGGFAGFAGPAYLPIALGQVKQWRAVLPKHISVIGAGGIQRGKHIHDYFLAGAAAFQINTALRSRGQLMFTTVKEEYRARLLPR